MSITFLEKRETQKQLVLILTILIIAFIIWQGFSLFKKPVISQEQFKPTKKVEINFKILESSFLTELQPFEEIQPFEIGKGVEVGQEITIGRDNPFAPYLLPSE